MTVSFYSFFMAVLWFSTFILLGILLQRKTGFMFCYRLLPLLLLLVLTLFRLLVPVEMPFTRIVGSTVVYPAIRDMLYGAWFRYNGAEVLGLHVLCAVWALVAAVLLVRLFLYLRRDARQLKALCLTPSPDAEDCLERLLLRHRALRGVRLSVSPNASAPMLLGLVRPVILLPQACSGLSRQELECILSHELTHLSNGDLWVKLLIRVLCCAFWWNPFVYLLKKDLDCILEYKCDLTVTKSMPDREKVAYLQTILQVVKQLSGDPAGPQRACALQVSFCGIPESTVLKRRFELVLKPKRVDRLFPQAVFTAVCLTVFVLSYSVVLQPVSSPPTNEILGTFQITPDNSYIMACKDGTYWLVYNNINFLELLPNELQDSPYYGLTIQREIEDE